MSSIDVNGKRLYCEEWGRGRAVLYVCGATGDVGDWAKVADAYFGASVGQDHV